MWRLPLQPTCPHPPPPGTQFGIQCSDMCTQEQGQAWLGNATAAAEKMGASATKLLYQPDTQAGEGGAGRGMGGLPVTFSHKGKVFQRAEETGMAVLAPCRPTPPSSRPRPPPPPPPVALVFTVSNKIFVAFGGPALFYNPDLLIDTDVAPLASAQLGPRGLPAGQGPVGLLGGLLDAASGIYDQVGPPAWAGSLPCWAPLDCMPAVLASHVADMGSALGAGWAEGAAAHAPASPAPPPRSCLMH
jgi:hypothetical protein